MSRLLLDRDLRVSSAQRARNELLLQCAMSGQIDSRQWAQHLREEPGLRAFVLSEYERADAIARRRAQN